MGYSVFVQKVSHDILNAVLEWIYCPDTSEAPREFIREWSREWCTEASGKSSGNCNDSTYKYIPCSLLEVLLVMEHKLLAPSRRAKQAMCLWLQSIVYACRGRYWSLCYYLIIALCWYIITMIIIFIQCGRMYGSLWQVIAYNVRWQCSL